jgi:hypothetical protein
LYSELEYSCTPFFIETEFKTQLLILVTLGIGFLIPFISDKEDLYVKRTSYYILDVYLNALKYSLYVYNVLAKKEFSAATRRGDGVVGVTSLIVTYMYC